MGDALPASSTLADCVPIENLSRAIGKPFFEVLHLSSRWSSRGACRREVFIVVITPRVMPPHAEREVFIVVITLRVMPPHAEREVYDAPYTALDKRALQEQA